MSIIYDALKKVEKNHHQDLPIGPVKKPKRSPPKTRKPLIYLFIICLAAFLGNIFFVFFKKVPAQSQNPPANLVVSKQAEIPVKQEIKPSPEIAKVETKKEEPPVFILNGIFFTEKETYALINNKIARVGDVINGALVKEITLDGVELDNAGNAVKLYSQKK